MTHSLPSTTLCRHLTGPIHVGRGGHAEWAGARYRKGGGQRGAAGFYSSIGPQAGELSSAGSSVTRNFSPASFTT